MTLSLLQPIKMASLSNSRLQNRKACPNRSTNNGDMVDKCKHSVVSESLSKTYLIIEKL